MSDKEFMNYLKDLEKRPIIELKGLNEEILELFPEKEYLKGAKKAKYYFRKLVKYYLGEINKSNLEKTLKLLDTIYKKIYTNLKTLDSTFTSDIRKPIFKKYGRNSEEHKMSKKLAKLSYEDKGKVIAEAHTNLRERHKEIKRFSPEGTIKIIVENIESKEDFKVLVALALASGCRPAELMDTNVHFTVLEDNPKWVFQDFLKKKRDAEQIGVKKPIIGISPNKFIEKIGDTRHSIKGDYRKVFNRDGQLSTAIDTKANEAMKEIFGYEEGITLYSARKIYGQLSYELFGKDSIYGKDPSLNQWLSSVLGHSIEDLTTSLHYSDFKPTEKEVNYAQVLELSAKIEFLQKRLDEGNFPQSVPEEAKLKIGPKLEKHFAKIKEIYDAQDPKPNQTQLETLCKGIIPRSSVRLWYKQREL